MGFEEGAVSRFKRYRRDADQTLEDIKLAEEAAKKLSGRLFDGLEHCVRYAREAGFEVEVGRGDTEIRIKLSAAEGATSEVVFAFLEGAASEADEYLMHEELSRHTLPSAGYSGRILGWVSPGGEGPCQVFAVYRDGTWRTKGMLVEKSRGKLDDPEEVLRGFCLRILGRMVDLCVPTDGVGRLWRTEKYTLLEYEREEMPRTETRWLK